MARALQASRQDPSTGQPRMTLEQIHARADVARRQYAHYSAWVDRCTRVLVQAHDLGWKVALQLNDERAVRGAESLLGAHLRSDFAPSTRLSRLIYGP
jgi:hypothetical protein